MEIQIEESKTIKNRVQELLQYCLKKENTKKRINSIDEYKQDCMKFFSQFHERYPTLFFTIIENPSTFPMYRLDELLNVKNLVDDKKVSEQNASIALGQKYYNEFVKDTVNAFIKIAQCNELIGHEVNIATQSEISVGALAQNLIDQIKPNAKIITDNQRLRPEKSEVFRLFGSNAKLKEYTSWAPEYSLNEGLAETIEWFRNIENLKQYKADIYNV